jgi:hypothetical protein
MTTGCPVSQWAPMEIEIPPKACDDVQIKRINAIKANNVRGRVMAYSFLRLNGSTPVRPQLGGEFQ